MKRTSVLFVLAMLLFFVCRSSAGLASGEGAIQGRVVNGTAGGGATEGLQIALHIFQGNLERRQLTSITDAQGRFRFEGLETGSDAAYLMRVSYQGVMYSRGPVSFEAGQALIETEIPIYETTTSGEGIAIEMAHLILQISDTTLTVAELHVFSNPGDRTFIGAEQVQGRRVTSRFTLPQGSRDLAFDDGSLGGRFLSVRGGFVDTEPQWPGRTTVVFRYVLDCPRGECSLTKEVTHPTSNLNVLIADSGVEVETERLSFAGPFQVQGQSYLSYVGRNLATGERFSLHLTRSRQQVREVAASSTRSPLGLAFIVLAAAAVVLALGYPFWKQYRQGQDTDDGPTNSDS